MNTTAQQAILLSAAISEVVELAGTLENKISFLYNDMKNVNADCGRYEAELMTIRISALLGDARALAKLYPEV